MKTMVLNRKVAPPLEFFKGLNIPVPEKLTLSNGLPVYSISGLPQDVLKIEIIFKAGKWYEQKKLIAKSVSHMLKEGTKHFNALQIAQELDYYGASFRTFSGNDHATFTLFSLNKYLDKVLPVLEEVIKRPVFPQNELNILLKNDQEHLKVNLLKNDFVADRKFTEALYGPANPYGYFSALDDFDQVKPGELVAFHRQFYHAGNCSIIISGNVETSALKLLEQYFGGNDWAGNATQIPEHTVVPVHELKAYYPVKDSVQSAIRIGKTLFNKTHADYHKFNVLNTVLGGYFGSRLMSNIREDKGYTYGIYSNLQSMLHSGYFIVATEVGVGVCEDAVKEIYKEIKQLQEKPVEKDELDLVRNYLVGHIQSGLDGPFKISGLFKGLLIYGLDIDYIYQLIDTINTVTALELQELAGKYLDVSNMHEVIVG